MKPGLFVYECARIVILIVGLVYSIPEAGTFPCLVFAASSALFPLMAMFIWLNVFRYREYLPLFLAGKCIGIILLVLWSIFQRGIITDFFNIKMILLSGDIFAIIITIMIIKNLQTEEKECE